MCTKVWIHQEVLALHDELYKKIIINYSTCEPWHTSPLMLRQEGYCMLCQKVIYVIFQKKKIACI